MDKPANISERDWRYLQSIIEVGATDDEEFNRARRRLMRKYSISDETESTMARKTKKKTAPAADDAATAFDWPDGFSADSHIAPPSVMDRLRHAWIDGVLLPWARKVFSMNPEIQSGVLFVSQYWNDEANDAVHERFAWYSTPEPPLDYASEYSDENPEGFVVNVAYPRAVRDTFGNGLSWDDNGLAVGLFACFCNERGSQEDETGEGWEPFCTFVREPSGQVKAAFVGTKIRKWLDGAFCEWDQEHGAEGQRDWIGESEEASYGSEHMLSAISVSTARAARLRALGIDVTSIRDLHVVDPWVVRALAIAGEEQIALAVRGSAIRDRIDAMLRTGGKVRKEKTGGA